MRLDKLLAHTGYGSRKDVKKLIASGQVTLNGQACRKPGQVIKLDKDLVQVMGQTVDYQEYYFIMLNKPKGVISATEDHFYQTVVDLVEEDYGHVDLFPVGRLDLDTRGLLLLTNHGQVAHQLLSPKKQVKKVYQALVQGRFNEADMRAFELGMDLGDFVSLPADLLIVEDYPDQDQSLVQITVQEGKFHQVKRMVAACGNQVLELKRLSMGPIDLDPLLEPGQYRHLNKEELDLLKDYGL